MEPSAESILAAAMKLPEDQRLVLASRLLESATSDEATTSIEDAELAAELDRRFADRDGAVPWTELRAEQ